MTTHQQTICDLYSQIYTDAAFLPEGQLQTIRRIRFNLGKLGVLLPAQTIRISKPYQIRREALKAMLDKLAQS